MVSNLEKGVQETRNIFENLDNINLSSGKIILTAKRGKVYLDKVHFKGSKSDLVKYSDFFGTVDYDGKLEIKTKSDISGIRLPLDIKGTIDEPSANLAAFVPKFLTINTLNILNPMNIIDFLVDTGKGFTNTIKSTGEVVVEPFIKGKSK